MMLVFMLLPCLITSCGQANNKSQDEKLKNEIQNYPSKVKNAVKSAGIKEQDEDYYSALSYVSILGPMGPDRGIENLVKSSELGVMDSEDVSEVISSRIGSALAYYYGKRPIAFKAEAYAKGVIDTSNQIGPKVQRGINSIKDKFHDFEQWVKETISYPKRVKEAVENAGIKEGDNDYRVALTYVSLLGPLGYERSINTLLSAQKSNVFKEEDVSEIISSRTGIALARYFGMEPAQFKARAYRKGIVNTENENKPKLYQGMEAIGKKLNQFKTWLQKGN